MDYITQKFLNNFNYSKTVYKLIKPNPSDYAYPNQAVYRIIALLGITSPISFDEIIELRWSDLIRVNSKNKPIVKERISITRYYDYYLPSQLTIKITDTYNVLRQPNLNSKLIDSIDKESDTSSILFPVFISLGTGDAKWASLDDFRKKLNKDTLQKIYGRRVLEVEGYTNDTSKFLKSRFHLKTNKELFEFLGYESILDLKYKLSNISLIEGLDYKYEFGEPPSYLDDNKHFESNTVNEEKAYPFQHFQVFYDFLIKSLPHKYDDITQSVLVLLLISLTNGIRMSSLLSLKWSDIIIFDSSTSIGKFSSKIELSNLVLTLNNDIIHKLIQLYRNRMERKGSEELNFISDSEISFSSPPELNIPVFITNNSNQLTQPSLSREIKKSLDKLGFKHYKYFKTESTIIMFGRRVVEIKGNHKPTLKKLKNHLNFHSYGKLFEFLYIDEYKGNKGKSIQNEELLDRRISQSIVYDV